jgi:hypothetical protein
MIVEYIRYTIPTERTARLREVLRRSRSIR